VSVRAWVRERQRGRERERERERQGGRERATNLRGREVAEQPHAPGVAELAVHRAPDLRGTWGGGGRSRNDRMDGYERCDRQADVTRLVNWPAGGGLKQPHAQRTWLLTHTCDAVALARLADVFLFFLGF
jgi:hypothetical protein